MTKKLSEYILDSIYPKKCPFCGRIPEKNNLSCSGCQAKVPYITEPRCMKCSKPILNKEKEYCYDCMERKYHYISGKALWIYDDIMRQSIARFKYGGNLEYAKVYGKEMANQHGKWVRNHADVLVPVPLHKRKEKARGYNQAQILANIIGDLLDVPVEANLLERIKDTKPQKELNDKQRLLNLSEAFQISKGKPCRFQKVMLVDDIYTTGSTVEACANILYKNGIREVYFLSICIGKGF